LFISKQTKEKKQMAGQSKNARKSNGKKVEKEIRLGKPNFHSYNHSRTWWMQGNAETLLDAQKMVISQMELSGKQQQDFIVVPNQLAPWYEPEILA
jgi:hypothetical protein